MPRKKKKKSKSKPVKSKNVKKIPLPKKVNLADQKIEIKKIKKQATEKKEYNINDFERNPEARSYVDRVQLQSVTLASGARPPIDPSEPLHNPCFSRDSSFS